MLVDSLLEQYDGLEGMDLAEVQALLGEHPYTREDPEVGMYRDGYYIGAGRENSGREEVMVLQFRDGEVIRVEFEDAGCPEGAPSAGPVQWDGGAGPALHRGRRHPAGMTLGNCLQGCPSGEGWCGAAVSPVQSLPPWEGKVARRMP